MGHLKNTMTNFERLKSLILKDRLSPDLEKYLEQELFYLECNEKDCDYILSAHDKFKTEGTKTANPNNSTVIYLIGLSDAKPKVSITKTPVSLPDIDYDTDGRDQIKSYLVKKYGAEKVSLLGTYNTLKTKGAIKDVVRQVRPDLQFEEVNKITKKFDLLKRTDFKTEIEFFEATLEADKEIKKWFEQNKDINDAVRQLLGNAKSTGIHAGGIVVSRVDIKDVVPLTYERNEQIWVTQPEMADVEGAGLIKYDFLGLKTLGDLNRCLQLVNSRYGKNYTLSNVPLDDKDVLAEFKKGNTTSVFQFNTDLATSILTKLNNIQSINDLAIITSIARPGPLNMGMDKTFVDRKNGKERIEYLHPSLELLLKNTYGIVVFQETVMQIVQEIGGLSGDESVTVLKAMGKKVGEKLVKFEKQFKENALKKFPDLNELVEYEDIETKVKSKISKVDALWNILYSFSSYGFNKCLSGDTKVKLISGEEISIFELRKINLEKTKVFLKSYNVKTNKIEGDLCEEVIDSGIKELYEVELSDGSKIKCTMDHEFVCSDGEKHKLKEIIENDLEIFSDESPDAKLRTTNTDNSVLIGELLKEAKKANVDFHRLSQKFYNVPEKRLRYLLKKNNIYLKKRKSSQKKEATKKEEQLIIKYYVKKRKSPDKIAKILNNRYSADWIRSFLKKKGLFVSSSNHYSSVDKNFFSVIDSRKKGYYLGFLMGDGCIRLVKNKYPQITLAVSEKDKLIIEKLKKDLKIHNIIQRKQGKKIKIKKTNKFSYIKPAVAISINNKEIFNDLCSLKCGVNKSKTAGFPEIEKNLESNRVNLSVDKINKIYAGFILGLVDSDGYIMISKKYKRITVGIVGTKKLLSGVSKKIASILKIPVRDLNKHGNIWRLQWTKRGEVFKILKFLYENKEDVFLKRKYKKATIYLKNPELKEKRIKRLPYFKAKRDKNEKT